MASPLNIWPVLPSQLVENNRPLYVDARLLLFQAAPFALQQHVATNALQASLMRTAQLFQSPSAVPEANLAQEQIQDTEPSAARDVQSHNGMDNTLEEQPPLAALLDEQVSESFLSLLGIDSNQPRFTDEHEAIKQAVMTNEERAAALSAMFGRYCAVVSHQPKSRKDLDGDSIQFLIRQMRVELDRIHHNEKEALMEAQAKCEAFEFSDERLERFLRCEDMNTKLGAECFAHYWNCRKKVFEPEKYLMPMTLSGALEVDTFVLGGTSTRLFSTLIDLPLTNSLPSRETAGQSDWHPFTVAARPVSF